MGMVRLLVKSILELELIIALSLESILFII
jgi:hypothetical protein